MPLPALDHLALNFSGEARGWHRLPAPPLQRLCVMGDRLPHLPPLHSLTGLLFFGNRSMPAPSEADVLACLSHLTNIQELVLSDCNLPAIASVVSRLTRLTDLDLSRNPIAAGHEHLGHLPALQYVDYDAEEG